MPRNPNVTCHGCGKPMQSRLPQGEATCNPCRNARSPLEGREHGRARTYRLGCRCAECRAEVARQMREYTRRRTERDGMSQFAQRNRDKATAEGRGYAEPYETTCPVCGLAVTGRGRQDGPVMHRKCRHTSKGIRLLAISRGEEVGVVAAMRKKLDRAAKGTPATGRVFTQGPCQWCEKPFCAPMGKWCSAKCKASDKIAKRKPHAFIPTPQLRAEVYERDNWTCGLCWHPIDSSLAWPNKWSASLDHIIPQAHMLIPDHSARNLRAVHLQCNSMRGDGSNMSEGELRARVSAAIAA